MRKYLALFCGVGLLIVYALFMQSQIVIGQTGGTQNVTWTTNSPDITITGNSLQKTSGCDGCTSGATSQQSIAAGDGYVEFTAAETNTYRFCGLTNGNVNGDYNQIAFAIELTGGGTAEVRENNNYRSQTNYVTGDVFRVSIEGGVIKYYKNGVAFYTNSSPTIV